MAKEKKPMQSTQSIETSLAQIEEVVDKLESGEIDLEEAIKNYEKGMELIERCREILKHSKLRVEQLKKKAVNAESNIANEDEDEEKKPKGLF